MQNKPVAEPRPAIRRFDLIAAILVSLTAGFSAGKIWVRDVDISSPWKEFRARAPIRAYLSNHPIRKLQIGAGLNSLPGWLNTDLEPRPGQAYLDAAKPFPLPDRSFRYVFSEHLIEHLTYDQGLTMLRECYRILEPGGTLRIETPNLQTFVALFDPSKAKELAAYREAKFAFHDWLRIDHPECLVLNYELRDWGHQFVYDRPTLRARLALAGFRVIKDAAPGQSMDAQLRNIGLRHRSNIAAMNDYETMVLEAIR